MTDTKPKPTQENVERARAWIEAAGFNIRVASLAEQFQASDAIARRRAIEAAMDIVSRAYSVNEAFASLASLLRAPTSEQTSETVNREKRSPVAGTPTINSDCRTPLPPLAGGGSEEPALTTRTCERCGGTGVGSWDEIYGVADPCPACSPPADGGGG